jgi:hypothetical protein
MEAPEKIDPKKIKWDDLESLKLSESGKIDLRNYLLNQNPAKSWIKKHPLYNNDYLPIDKVEFLLTIFFKIWRVEVKNVFQIANSVCVTVRLYYQDADSNKLNWQDGAGANPLQVNSGAKPMDSDAIKSNAVMLALPIAETNAIKDAADKIGKIFGRDLNRKDTLNYDILVKNETKFNNAKIIEK